MQTIHATSLDIIVGFIMDSIPVSRAVLALLICFVACLQTM